MNNNYDLEIAREILRIRLSQMIVNEKYKNGEFKIPIHLALGHEAIAVAVDAIMGEEDQLVLSHRNIHYNLARSKSLKPELDEYFLKKEGLAGGKLGSMNLANEDKNIVYTSSILGNNLPVAAGLALGQKVRGLNGVVIVTLGDGAIEEGSFYESIVFLKSNELPSIIIMENNRWSLATMIEERRYNIDFQKLLESVNTEYVMLSSNDPYEYIKELITLRKQALNNKTPVFLEVGVTTLGSRYLKTEDYPEGKFINYHAGPAPTVKLAGWPLIENSVEDPVFVLQEYFEQKLLERESQEILQNLMEEIN
ncbi:thiamine pyrophosphate-dependent enzyme [Chloroflexota bacterium]